MKASPSNTARELLLMVTQKEQYQRLQSSQLYHSFWYRSVSNIAKQSTV